MSLHSKEEFIKFYEDHSVKIRGLLFRLVGEAALKDLTQEVFMKAWMHRKKFRQESEASTWMYRIAYNCAVDYLRKESRKVSHGLPELMPDSLEQSVSMRQMVELGLANLDLEHKSVVVLFYLEDLSVKEVADTLGIPEGTVKSRLSHARDKMNKFLGGKGVPL